MIREADDDNEWRREFGARKGATMRKAVLFAVLMLPVGATVALAQQWGHPGTPRDGVCFYKDPNFHGDYFCVSAGDEYNHMPEDMNDEISSVKFFGRAEAFVYQDVRFEGRSTRFDRDIKNLKDEGWNDRISSIRVRSVGHGSSGGSHGRPADDPDRIVRRAYQDVLQREPDASGMRLYRSRIIDDGWSEAQVRESLRNSPEYRERTTMTKDKAFDVVRRAYLSVLKREPDTDARTYVDRVLRDHWTQADVERELRKSAEYRRK
jgi:Peptidase inhibitor family I36